MNNYYFELDNRKYVLIVAENLSQLNRIIKEKHFHIQRRLDGKLTGRLYVEKSKTFANYVGVLSSLPLSAQLIQTFPTKKIDILANEYLKLEKELKQKEKDIINYLKTKPDCLELGSKYGAYYRHTSSTRISYKDVLDKVMLLLKKVFTLSTNKDYLDVINFYEELVSPNQPPHKSSAASLRVFESKDEAEEIKKIWFE